MPPAPFARFPFVNNACSGSRPDENLAISFQSISCNNSIWQWTKPTNCRSTLKKGIRHARPGKDAESYTNTLGQLLYLEFTSFVGRPRPTIEFPYNLHYAPVFSYSLKTHLFDLSECNKEFHHVKTVERPLWISSRFRCSSIIIRPNPLTNNKLVTPNCDKQQLNALSHWHGLLRISQEIEQQQK